MRILFYVLMVAFAGTSGLSGIHMRTIIVFFIALIAIPVVEVAFAPALERGGTPILTDRSSKILIALGEQLLTRDTR